MKTKGIIIICAVLFLATIIGMVHSNNTNPSYDIDYEQDDFVSDYSPGEENLNGNTCENLKNGAIVAKQGSWIYYCSDEGLYKTNEATGENYTIIYGEQVSDVAVCKDYVYFVLWDESDDGIFRVRTDGENLEKISDANEYFFENEYIYFTEKTPVGISSYDYSIVRKHVGLLEQTQPVYDLEENECFEGVYNGYVIISGKEVVSFCDTQTLAVQRYDWEGLAGDMHFDENKLICVDDSKISTFDILTKKISELEFYYRLNLQNVNNGKYYFTYYTGSSNVLGYTYISYINGKDTKYKELDTGNILNYVNIIDGWVYYAGAAGSSMYIGEIAKVDTFGDNFELIWSKN